MLLVVEGLFVVLGRRGDEAVGGVDDGFFDGGGVDGDGGGLPGEVAGGELQGVEEEAGAAGVEGGLGEAVDDLADGELDGGAVLGHGEGEGFGVRGAGEVGRGAVGLVEVAEVLGAQAGGVAAAAGGVDVAALVTGDCGGFGLVWHGWCPSRGVWVKS